MATFVVLATGSSPELAEEIAELSGEDEYEDIDWGSDDFGDGARDVISPDGFSMGALKGRKVWIVNAPNREPCDKLEAAGMVVECDVDWDHTGDPEIVIWCTEIPHVAGQVVLDFLGLSGFNIRTHETDPYAGGLGECGELFEITVRWAD